MKRQSTKYHPRVYEEACEWFVEFRTGTPTESVRGDFYAWLQEAPAHMAAYLDVAASWGQAGALDMTRRFPKDALIAEAAGGADNVLAHPATLDPAMASSVHEPRRLLSTGMRMAFAAGLAVLVTTVSLVTWWREYPTYSTGVGEERSILLNDGSTINLNARSRVRVHYTARERDIDLLDGQALFSVAKNPNRPFIVRTGSTLVRAVGTEFDVDRRIRETVVTVLEGVVSVAQARPARAFGFGQASTPAPFATPPLSPVYVSAGQQLTVAPSLNLQPVRVNVTAVTAWTHRELVFASTPLRDVVEEFNRYNDRQLVISDPDLDEFEIDGVFSSTDPTSLIRFLRQRPDIKVTQSGDEILISRR
ncbi:MAG: FecR family protein [Steroidobacteraceae bacterium]